MNNNEKQDQSIDPILIEKLKLLGVTPERNPDLVAQGRNRYLAELGGLPVANSPVSRGWLASLFRSRQRTNSVQIFSRSFALSTILLIILVGIMLFGGASATAFASQSSLPGDALYPVKMGLEQTRISLANDAYAQAKLHLQFAQRRLDEIKELLMQGRTSDVEFASNEFEFFIQKAMEATNTVMAADPERGVELSNLVSKALLDYAIALKAVLLEAPDPVKPVVEKALLVSQDGLGDEVEIFGVVESISDMEIWIDGQIYLINDLTEFNGVIAEGDSVKIHAILTPEGNMIVREIELAGSIDDNPDLGPGLGDDNGNSNASSPVENGNLNANDDGNENYSQDNESEFEDNENGNDSNGNVNDNESKDDKEENKSEDNQNENKSGENDNHSDENENKSEHNDNGNSNESHEEEDKEGNSNGD